MGQDFWDARRWQREFETKQVAFHTLCAPGFPFLVFGVMLYINVVFILGLRYDIIMSVTKKNSGIFNL